MRSPSGHKILVVDDNSATRRMVAKALKRNGHDVFEAPDGKTARELMRREQPCIVLQDLMLPDANGFELVAELRGLADNIDVTILAFSGFISELDDARVSRVGFDDVITKPIAPSRLVPLIEAHLPVITQAGTQLGSGRRVVVADDDPLQLKLIGLRLSRLGFDVEAVADGEAALEAVRRSRPDILISDVMMPRLDGFGVAMAVRRDPDLADLPVLLVTSSYVDPSDRDLARRAGANDLLPRTADLVELLEAVRASLSAGPSIAEPPPSAEKLRAVEQEHHARVLRQLERQVLLNNGLARRCSALASELTVLAGIADAVLEHRDVDTALDEALSTCFDAGGIAVGALYTLDGDELKVRSIGAGHELASREVLVGFFGHREVLDTALRDGRSIYLPSVDVPAETSRELLARVNGDAMLLVPVLGVERPLGALLMVTQGRDLDPEDWTTFARGVATQITHVLTVARAYSEREAAERRAVEHAAVLDAVVASAPDIVIRIDLDGTIRFINRELRGRPPETWLGKSLVKLTTGELAEKLRAALERITITGEPEGFEAPNHGSDGGVTWYSVRLGPVKEHGKVTGAVIVARDVSDKKQTELQLMVADRMASVGTLAAGVAHEINNPLASTIANLDMAIQDLAAIQDRAAIPASIAVELAEARAASDRVREIVRDLKIFSRAEDESHGPVDVVHVLDSTIRMAWNELRHRAKLVKNYEAVPLVEANESRLGQVFLHLLINAIHAIPTGNCDANRITVSTSVDATGRVVVRIADTGTGIPEDAQSRLFTPFFTTKPVGVGRGLGLAISHRIITQLGGAISFESKAATGTEFTVSLLVSANPVSVSSSQLTPALVRRGNVLVVDDEEMLATAIKRYLSTEHDVTAVTSARAALDLLEGGARYDVILCDLMMPQITGMDLHDQVLRRFPGDAEKMVFLTGGAFTGQARDFLATTTNPYLEKPFDLNELSTLVSRLLR